MRLLLHVPTSATPGIYSFCRQLAGGTPLLTPVRPIEGARELQCYFNVEMALKCGKGAPAFGWLIWQCADLWLEAHHHAVISAGDGSLFDVTPTQDGKTQIMFLPDPSRPFDYAQPKPFCRTRLCISNIPEVVSWVEALNALDKFMWRHSRFVGEEVQTKIVGNHELRRYERLKMEAARAESAAYLRVTSK